MSSFQPFRCQQRPSRPCLFYVANEAPPASLAPTRDAKTVPRLGWLNRTVLGIGLASLFSDWSHEIATTALGTAGFGFASAAWHMLIARASAWLGHGVHTPVHKAMLAAAITPEIYGRAFGFERTMDTLGAIVGPATAFGLIQGGVGFRSVFFWAQRFIRRRPPAVGGSPVCYL